MHMATEQYSKQELFGVPKIGALRKMEVVYSDGHPRDIAAKIAELGKSESLCVTEDLLDGGSAKYFRKHARVAPVRNHVPRNGIEDALDRSGTSLYGWQGPYPDHRLRVVPVCEVFEAAKLYAHM